MKTVLIAEHETTTAKWLRYVLAREGYHALSAPSGLEALAVIATDRPDLILLSADLPGLDAQDVLWDLRTYQGRCELPVVVIFPPGNLARRAANLSQFADCCIQRPFSEQFLVAIVGRLLNTGQAAP